MKTLARGCPLGAAPLQSSTAISINPLSFFREPRLRASSVYFNAGLTKTTPPAGGSIRPSVVSTADAKIGVLGVNGFRKVYAALRIMRPRPGNITGKTWVPRGVAGSATANRSRSRLHQDRAPERHLASPAKADPRSQNDLAMNYSDETADEMTQAAGRDRPRGLCGFSTARSIRRWTRWLCPPTSPISHKPPCGELRRVALCSWALGPSGLLRWRSPQPSRTPESVAAVRALRNYPARS